MLSSRVISKTGHERWNSENQVPIVCRNLNSVTAAPSSPTTGPPETPRTIGRAVICAAMVGQFAKNSSLCALGMAGMTTAR